MHAAPIKKNLTDCAQQSHLQMSIANLLEPSRVLANVEARSKKHAFEILSELIAGVSDELLDIDIFEALIDRERIGNTGLGHGIAIPHGSVAGLNKSTGAFLQLNEAVDFNAQDGEPVQFMFAVAVPDDEQADYFEEVARTAQALSDERIVGLLAEASGSRALFEILAALKGPESIDASPNIDKST